MEGLTYKNTGELYHYIPLYVDHVLNFDEVGKIDTVVSHLGGLYQLLRRNVENTYGDTSSMTHDVLALQTSLKEGRRVMRGYEERPANPANALLEFRKMLDIHDLDNFHSGSKEQMSKFIDKVDALFTSYI